MELFDRRRYYFCTYCGTFHFIETPAVDGIQVLERPPDAASCPLCRAPLAKALLDEAETVQHCEQCHGLLMARVVFAEAVDRRRSTEPGMTMPAPIDPRELKRQVTCPSCRARMDVHPYYGPGNVVIDTAAGVIWYGSITENSNRSARHPARDRPQSWRPANGS